MRVPPSCRFVALVLAALPFAPGLAAQAPVLHEHPTRAASVETPPGWTSAPRDGDPGVMTLAGPDGSAHGILWVTDTEQGARRYLSKMIGMKPLSVVEGPDSLSIDGRAAWRVRAEGREGADDGVSETLVVVRVDGDGAAGDNYVLQLWCPKERAGELEAAIDRIVASLRVGRRSS